MSLGVKPEIPGWLRSLRGTQWADMTRIKGPEPPGLSSPGRLPTREPPDQERGRRLHPKAAPFSFGELASSRAWKWLWPGSTGQRLHSHPIARRTGTRRAPAPRHQAAGHLPGTPARTCVMQEDGARPRWEGLSPAKSTDVALPRPTPGTGGPAWPRHHRHNSFHPACPVTQRRREPGRRDTCLPPSARTPSSCWQIFPGGRRGRGTGGFPSWAPGATSSFSALLLLTWSHLDNWAGKPIQSLHPRLWGTCRRVCTEGPPAP